MTKCSQLCKRKPDHPVVVVGEVRRNRSDFSPSPNNLSCQNAAAKSRVVFLTQRRRRRRQIKCAIVLGRSSLALGRFVTNQRQRQKLTGKNHKWLSWMKKTSLLSNPCLRHSLAGIASQVCRRVRLDTHSNTHSTCTTQLINLPLQRPQDDLYPVSLSS